MDIWDRKIFIENSTKIFASRSRLHFLQHKPTSSGDSQGLQTAVMPPASHSEEVHWEITATLSFRAGGWGQNSCSPKGLWQQPKQTKKVHWECYNKQIRLFHLQAQTATWSNLQIMWTPIVKPGAILGAGVVSQQPAKLGLAGKGWMCCGDQLSQEPTYPSFKALR